MKRLISLTGKELQTIINEQADKMIRQYLKENKVPQLWAEVRFVQGDAGDFNEIEEMFCGNELGYCEANSQPVIDYLKEWDGDDCELVTEEPRIARNDTQYEDENGEYTLLYNSSIGGCFLLYRPATEQEVDWYYSNGDGSMNESKKHNLTEGLRKYKGFKCINVSPDPSFPNYEIVSPEGHSIATTLFPSEMKEIVDKYLKFGSIKESIDYDDHWAISDALGKFGWAYSNSQDVKHRETGQRGVRYVIEPYHRNLDGIKPVDAETIKKEMTRMIGADKVIFSQGTYRYAPEIKNLSMIVLE